MMDRSIQTALIIELTLVLIKEVQLLQIKNNHCKFFKKINCRN